MMLEEPATVLEITRSPKGPEVAIAGTTTPSRRFQSRLRQNGHASDSSSLTDLDDSEAETERLGDSPYKNPTKIVHQPPASSNLSLTTTAFTMKKHTSREPDSPTKELQENDGDSHNASVPNSPTPAKKRKLNTGRGRSISPPHHDEIASVRSKSFSPLAPSFRDDDDIAPVVKRSQTEPVAGAAISETSTTPTVRHGLSPAPTGTENDDRMDVDSVHSEPHGSEKSEETGPKSGEVKIKKPASASHEDEDAEDHENEDDEEGTRKAAMEQLADIEKDFAKLRDKIFEERVQEVDNEIRMVEEGTHPQLLAMLEPVNKRRDENIQLANAKFNYAVQSLDTSTKATRAQIHSQYFQGIRFLREKYLGLVSQNWYQIQRERRASDTLVPDYTFRLNESKPQRILERKKYEKEVEILTKVQTTMGFPAAPEIKSLTAEELASDLQEMGVGTSRPRLTNVVRY
ncbi:hypothetical protein BJ508DRAFT_35943 [Ascobolus immersus RN42]|uniref:Uncharacterized protein n=1 Tax=Ascobolus immersus RN42 TaxID=1160509 RepID=A0A3N4HPB4_ASCIM|nr:hypothetical protein BJ508DRAFT_35943 [Ascobolus immersus RN42]